MIWTMLRRRAGSPLLAFLLLLGVGVIAGCDVLNVSDPTRIEDRDLDDALGVDLLRRDALKKFYAAFGNGALVSGLVADEFLSDPPAHYAQLGIVSPEELLDRRESARYERLGIDLAYEQWKVVRHAATVTLAKLWASAPTDAAPANIGEMLAVRGFVTLGLAEDFCPGFPLHEVVDLKPVFGGPLSTDEALERALADFDSVLVVAPDSTRILNLARVGRARTLLGLGRFAEAASAVEPVPTGYIAHAEYDGSINDQLNPLAFGLFNDFSRSVADQEGSIGLDFVDAADPRVQVSPIGKANDGTTGIYAITKYPDRSAPLVLASGIEARLIEAEVALRAGGSQWLTVLNSLRTDGTEHGSGAYNPGTGGVAGLAPLADPGNEAARVDLLFRERAFWLFATGHRLGDLRRLIRHYGRMSDRVFPSGTYRSGGAYGSATSLPFPAAKETRSGSAVIACTTR